MGWLDWDTETEPRRRIWAPEPDEPFPAETRSPGDWGLWTGARRTLRPRSRPLGRTTLFAALDARTGKVVGQCQRRHRAVEFRKFLDTIDATVAAELDVHLIVDNYSTHKTALIHRWLAKRPRYHVHFTPTGASWMNLVERWFGLLTEKQLRRNDTAYHHQGCSPASPAHQSLP